MTPEQLKAYREMGVAERPHYLVRIGQARNFQDAVKQIGARRSAWCRARRERAEQAAAERARRADHMAAIFSR
jgi:hypothetical protein